MTTFGLGDASIEFLDTERSRAPRWGSISANAGIWTLAPFWELTDQQWDEMIGVNLTGVWRSAKSVAPHMIERKSGSIVITSSTNGIEPGLNFARYVSAKHAVIGLMKNIALELAPYGIRCNSINPGAIRTGMTDHQAAWDTFAGHENGTEDDLIEGGYRSIFTLFRAARPGSASWRPSSYTAGMSSRLADSVDARKGTAASEGAAATWRNLATS